MKFQELQQYIWIVIILVLIRHIILVYSPQVVFSGYVFMFLIGFVISYFLSRNFHIALFIGLLVVYGRIIYRYLSPKEVLSNYVSWPNTIIFIVGLVAILTLARNIKKTKTLIYTLYFMILYLLSSLLEWFLHKYIMHCYTYFPWLLTNKISNPLIAGLQKSCQMHHDHHISVKKDMSLKQLEDENTLIFTWMTLAILFPPAYILSIIATFAIKLDIPFTIQGLSVLITLVIFGLVWNNMHPRMHDIKLEILLKDAPSDVNLNYTRLLYDNHKMHHIIKGKNKGNFNVVFLGADELFMSNNL